MKKIAIGMGALMLTLAVAVATPARVEQTSEKLPKCTSALCKKVGCSPSVLCVRGASVVNCADVCGGN
ncbi:MAG: hypothetical protein ACREAA_15970 [Candidatus Polarisedimenticolia bacterium]